MELISLFEKVPEMRIHISKYEELLERLGFK
jgi:hypothetical protein